MSMKYIFPHNLLGTNKILLCSLHLFTCCNGFSDASFGYPGGPTLFKNLNFGIDLDSRVASKIVLNTINSNFPSITIYYYVVTLFLRCIVKLLLYCLELRKHE